MKKFGLALGGGGVRGLAHALVLEALDEMDCRPSVIAGTSIGAIMGAIYASGVPGRAIRENIQGSIVSRRDTWRDIFRRRSNLMKMVRTVAFERGRGGTLKPDLFLNFLLSTVHKTTFEELNIPLLVSATDYWTGEEVVLKSGDLLPALKASIAIPGVFAPVIIDGRVLLDGGIVNIVPYENIIDRCDVSIAVDVAGSRTQGRNRTPNVWDSILGSFEMMQEANKSMRMESRKPDVYVRPDIVDVSLLAFGKASRVLREAAPAISEMKQRIEELLNRP